MMKTAKSYKACILWVPVTDFIPSDRTPSVGLLLGLPFFLGLEGSLQLSDVNVLFEAPWGVLSNLFAKDSWPLLWRTLQKPSKCRLSFVSRILINISTIPTLSFWSSIREYSTSVRNGRSSGRKFRSKIPVLSSWWHSLNARFLLLSILPTTVVNLITACGKIYSLHITWFLWGLSLRLSLPLSLTNTVINYL